jgi:hypothetical protein
MLSQVFVGPHWFVWVTVVGFDVVGFNEVVFDVGFFVVGFEDVGFIEVGAHVEGFDVVGFDDVGFNEVGVRVEGFIVVGLDVGAVKSGVGLDEVGVNVELALGFCVVGVNDGIEVGVVDGRELGTEEGFDEGIIVGVDVGMAVTVEEDGIAVVEGPAEHPAVFFTSATTASLHVPPVSCAATQKKAPPLHEYCPLLYVRRSDMILTAWVALVFEPVPLQSKIHIPNTTLCGCVLNISFARDENKTPALIAPAPDPPMPST